MRNLGDHLPIWETAVTRPHRPGWKWSSGWDIAGSEKSRKQVVLTANRPDDNLRCHTGPIMFRHSYQVLLTRNLKRVIKSLVERRSRNPSWRSLSNSAFNGLSWLIDNNDFHKFEIRELRKWGDSLVVRGVTSLGNMENHGLFPESEKRFWLERMAGKTAQNCR